MTRNGTTIIAVFDNAGLAETAIDELEHWGFSDKEIGLAAPGHSFEEPRTPIKSVEVAAAGGASTGAIAGGAAGLLLGGLAVGLIPGIGQVIAGGILGGMIFGAAAGATAGTWAGPFIAMGLSKKDVAHCEEQLKSGRALVAVHPGDRVEEVRSILHAHGGKELEPELAGSGVG